MQGNIDESQLFWFETLDDALQAGLAVKRSREAAGVPLRDRTGLCRQPYCQRNDPVP